MQSTSSRKLNALLRTRNRDGDSDGEDRDTPLDGWCVTRLLIGFGGQIFTTRAAGMRDVVLKEAATVRRKWWWWW